MTWDERLHWFGGYLMAFRGLHKWRNRSSAAIIRDIDLYGFYREWAQNLKGKDPNPTLSIHQLFEARAWGLGARAFFGSDMEFPPDYDARKPVTFPFGYPGYPR